MHDFHGTFRDILHAANLRHGTHGFTSLPKEGVLRIFSPLKIRRLRPGLNPRTWVPKASTLPLDHRSRYISYCSEIKRRVFPQTEIIDWRLVVPYEVKLALRGHQVRPSVRLSVLLPVSPLISATKTFVGFLMNFGTGTAINICCTSISFVQIGSVTHSYVTEGRKWVSADSFRCILIESGEIKYRDFHIMTLSVCELQ